MVHDVDFKLLIDALTNRVTKLEEKADGFAEGIHALDKGVDAAGNAIERALGKATESKLETHIAADKICILADKVHDLQWRHIWMPVIAMFTIMIALAVFSYSYTHDAVSNIEHEITELRKELTKGR